MNANRRRDSLRGTLGSGSEGRPRTKEKREPFVLRNLQASNSHGSSDNSAGVQFHHMRTGRSGNMAPQSRSCNSVEPIWKILSRTLASKASFDGAAKTDSQSLS